MTTSTLPASDPSADPFARSVWPKVAGVLLAIYVIYACAQMEISWERVEVGLANAAHFFGRLFPPNYLHESWQDYLYWDTEPDP